MASITLVPPTLTIDPPTLTMDPPTLIMDLPTLLRADKPEVKPKPVAANAAAATPPKA
ncbi:MAG: hypothetical protein DHS80DRAFT_32539 [Piptocephalis tieghemiana]|nr:MAG: hypothetical protein DHS80DRAFT_32539 [Piptocephalis tieghemiana]